MRTPKRKNLRGITDIKKRRIRIADDTPNRDTTLDHEILHAVFHEFDEAPAILMQEMFLYESDGDLRGFNLDDIYRETICRMFTEAKDKNKSAIRKFLK